MIKMMPLYDEDPLSVETIIRKETRKDRIMDRDEIIERNLFDKDVIERILNEDRGKEKRYKLHIWSMIVGMICGVIGTHIWQYVERLF